MTHIIVLFSALIMSTEPIVTDTTNTKDGGTITTSYTDCEGNGSYDIIATRKNISGAVLWSKTFGGSSYDKSRSAIESADTNIYILGFTSSYGNGNYDLYVITLDSSGNEIWSQTYRDFYYDYPKGISETKNNQISITATKQVCFGEKNNFSNCSSRLWEIKIEETGKMLSENF